MGCIVVLAQIGCLQCGEIHIRLNLLLNRTIRNS